MVHLNILLTVREESDVEKVRGLLAEQGRRSREEPGCVRFEVYHSRENPSVFLLNEWWESEGALETHRRAEAYTTIYQPKVLPLVERVPHPCTLVE